MRSKKTTKKQRKLVAAPTAVAAIHKEYDVRIDQLVRSKRKTDTIPCEAGCHACCYDVVMTTPHEVVSILDMIKIDDEFRWKIYNWYQAVTTAGIDPDDPDPDVLKYNAAKIPCPLLSKDGMCTVYDVRPVACRGHYVVNTPPAMCAKKGDGDQTEKLDVNNLSVAALVKISDAVAGMNAPVQLEMLGSVLSRFL